MNWPLTESEETMVYFNNPYIGYEEGLLFNFLFTYYQSMCIFYVM